MKSKNILLVTYCISDEYAKWIFSHDLYPGVQTNTFAHSIVSAFEHSGYDIEVISSPPVQDFPIVSIEDLPFSDLHFQKARGFVFASSNRSIRKRIDRFLFVLIHTYKTKPNYVFFHGLYLPYLIVGVILKILGIKTALILTDPAGVVLKNDSNIRKILKTVEKKISHILTRSFSGGIALSSDLASYYIRDKPVLVIPGIAQDPVASSNNEDNKLSIEKTSHSLRMAYFGSLATGYGVLELAKFIALCDLDIQFDIYGFGPEVEDIAEFANNNPKISLKGKLERSKSLMEMRQYDILVNPRPVGTHKEKNSFPSKIFDYAFVKKPILTTAINGLPIEIRKYLFEYNIENPSEAIEILSNIINIKDNNLSHIGEQFSNKLFSEYNSKATGKKIQSLLAEL